MAFEDRIAAHRRRPHMHAFTAVLIIGGSSYFSMLVGVLRSILVMRFIPPQAQGIRRIVDIYTRYFFNSHLGVLHGTNRALPIHLGEGDHQKAQEVEDVGITWTIALTFLGALVLAVHGLARLHDPSHDSTKALAIIIGGGWLLTQQTYTLYRTVIRAWGNFAALGLIGAIDTVATFALTLLGAWKYGVIGAMLGTLAAWLIALLALHFLAPLHIRPRFDLRLGLKLAVMGLPIAAMIFADTLLRTIDGTIISHYFGDYSMGLYSMAMQMGSYLFAIPEAAGFVIWPKILHAYGAAAGDEQALRRQIVLPTLISGIFMPILAGIAYVMLPPLVSIVLPKYALAIPAAQILAIASVFLALPMATNSLLIANNRGYICVVVKLLGAGVSTIGCMWLVKHHGTLEQLATAAGAGYAVAALLSLAVVLPQYERTTLKQVGLFAAILLPFVWGVASVVLSYYLAGFFMMPSPGSWAWAGTRLGAFLLLMIPILYFGNSQTHLVREFRVTLKPRKPKGGDSDGRDT